MEEGGVSSFSTPDSCQGGDIFCVCYKKIIE